MNVIMTIGGRRITDADVAAIRQLVAQTPNATRAALSRKVCEQWNWRQANGVLKDGVCRTMLVQLHRAGHIELPPPRSRHVNRPSKANKDENLWTVQIDQTPVTGPLSALQPLSFRQVRRTVEEPRFGALMEQFHELGYTHPIGEHLKYLVYAQGRVVAALAWSSAPHGLGPRDRFIGWSTETRKRNRHLIAYNSRFLVMPWVHVPHLASHVLGQMARRLSADWQHYYAHPLYFLETFIDPARHRGTCYRAANWIVLGQTVGRGHRCPTMTPNRSIKQVLGYPLSDRFRERLNAPAPEAQMSG